MLKYKDGCFSSGNLAFSIPDGFFVETVGEVEIDDGFVLYSPDQSYSIMIQIAEMEGTTETELQDMLNDSGFHIVQPLAPISVNKLNGHYAIYQADNITYYEVRLAADEIDDMQVMFYIRAKNLREVLQSEGAIQALHSIHQLK